MTETHQYPTDFPQGITQQQKGGERTVLKQSNFVTGSYSMKIP